MRFRDKGFTLVELMVTVAIAVIVLSIAVPAFTSVIARTNADSEISELNRALNYARTEAINRGVAVRVVPVVNNTWTGVTRVQVGSVANVDTLLREFPAMRAGSVVTATSANGAAAYIEFNNLGALNFPLVPVTLCDIRGTQNRRLDVSLNGRVLQGTTCP